MRHKKERQSLANQLDYAVHRKPTKTSRFLDKMERVVPWAKLVALVRPHYPTGARGRPPIPLERMLRIYFLQHWYNLSDPGVEDRLNEDQSMRRFAGVDLGLRRAPDETTICRFRHRLESIDFGEGLFALVDRHLAAHGISVRRGSIVDASIIEGPKSVKKGKDGKRKLDPEMGHTRKNDRAYFGVKAHIGVDSKTKQIHSVVTTPANVHDSQVVGELLHGGETRVWGDKAYVGQREAIRAAAPAAQCHVLKRKPRGGSLTESEKKANRTKSRVRARVEHPFHLLKNVFGYTKTRYRGFAKNAHAVRVKFALLNLYQFRGELLAF